MQYKYEDTVGSLDERLVVANTEKAIESALADTPSIFGKRPRDWLSRDLLIGSSLADRRNWMFRNLLGSNPGFLRLGLSPAMQNHENLIRQGRVFAYLHALHVLDMRAACREANYSTWSNRRILDCPTTFWSTASQNGLVGPRRVCKRGWVCPYCYARASIACFQKLSTQITVENCGFLALISTVKDVLMYDKKEVNKITEDLRVELLRWARHMGGCGGLWAVQLSPVLDQKTIWTKGEIEYAGEEAMSLRVAVLSQIPNTLEAIDRLESYLCKGARGTTKVRCGQAENIQVDLLPFHGPQTIRAALVAAGPMSTSSRQIENNSHGLFYWPPVWLCSPEQWQFRCIALGSRKRYSPWGTFRNAPPVNSTPAIVAQSTIGTPSQSEIAEARRKQLFSEVSPIIKSNMEATGKSLGRQLLLKQLKAEGHNVSDRDVRWIIERLKCYYYESKATYHDKK